MKTVASILFALLVGCTLAGCSDAPQPKAKAKPPSKDDAIQTALAQLSAEDRKIAEAQKFCAVHAKTRLGSMETPVKVMISGEPVFLCCSGCEAAAAKDKEATLKKAKELKDANK